MRNRSIAYFLRAADYISASVHPLSKSFNKGKIRILGYHRVSDDQWVAANMTKLNTPVSVFRKQMEYLYREKFNVITMEELIDVLGKAGKPPPKTAIITFDDGYQDNYYNAFPILREFGFNGTFFVVTDYIGTNNTFNWLSRGDKHSVKHREHIAEDYPFTERQILEMYASGACFGSHTRSHPKLTQLSEKMIKEEIEGSKECLEVLLSAPVRCFCYPFGDTNKLVKSLVQAAGYRAIVGGEGINSYKSNLSELKRIPTNQDLRVFIRKMGGAYDWYYDWLLPAYSRISRIN